MEEKVVFNKWLNNLTYTVTPAKKINSDLSLIS